MKIVIYKNKMKMLNVVVASLLLAGCSGGGSGTSVSSTDVTTPTSPYTAVTLPEKTEDARILAVGQSLMGPSGMGLAYTSQYDVIRLTTNFDEEVAVSPVKGISLPTGADGSTFLPVFGDLLIKDGKYDFVTYIDVAVGGTQISQWVPSNKDGYFYKIKRAIEQGIDFNIIIFQQGSSDGSEVADTPTDVYKERFLEMLQGIRDLGCNAPIYVAKSSAVQGHEDYDIIRAQSELIVEYSDIFEGPYTDPLGSAYRYDGNHFNKLGLMEHAKMWADSVK